MSEVMSYAMLRSVAALSSKELPVQPALDTIKSYSDLEQQFDQAHRTWRAIEFGRQR